MTDSASFSERHGFRGADVEITTREDAPEGVRAAVVMLGYAVEPWYHDLLCRFIDHEGEVELRQSEIANFKFPLKLTEVRQVDSKVSPAVQLADVMIGAALEAANVMTGLRDGGLDPEK